MERPKGRQVLEAPTNSSPKAVSSQVKSKYVVESGMPRSNKGGASRTVASRRAGAGRASVSPCRGRTLKGRRGDIEGIWGGPTRIHTNQ
jgi:hypothetical protein